MKILALEPYFGGSHQAFLEGWSSQSRHEWTILKLPAYKWKWRMRHASVTFANEVTKLAESGETWDIIFCSDMLNLAEFTGLSPKSIQCLPSIVYFHENLLSYPVRFSNARDYHFGAINLTTALCATQVWFNSKFHLNDFTFHLEKFLKKMPDNQLLDSICIIKNKSQIFPPGIDKIHSKETHASNPLKILWAARWEYDKGPDILYKALEKLSSENLSFRLTIIGEQYKQTPEIFDKIKNRFSGYITKWGYQKDRNDYLSALRDNDIIVSTALHEFFGISVVEAIAAGLYPILPKRLAYPEIIDPKKENNDVDFFYDGSYRSLALKMSEIIRRCEKSETDVNNLLWQGNPGRCIKYIEPFYWERHVEKLDDAVESVF